MANIYLFLTNANRVVSFSGIGNFSKRRMKAKGANELFEYIENSLKVNQTFDDMFSSQCHITVAKTALSSIELLKKRYNEQLKKHEQENKCNKAATFFCEAEEGKANNAQNDERREAFRRRNGGGFVPGAELLNAREHTYRINRKQWEMLAKLHGGE